MRSNTLDRMGSIASAACALHCLVLTVAPAAVAVLGLELLREEAFEWGFFIAAAAFALLAAGLGFRQHRDARVLGAFGGGLALLTAARLGEALGLFGGTVVLAVLGGATLVASHWMNTARRRACTQDCCGD